MMGLKIISAIIIFIIGELISNYTVFKYLSKYFKKKGEESATESSKPILGIKISVFKGILERLVLFTAFIYGIMPMLVVFGALKIGTRLDASKKETVSNDYFLIGNLISILIAIIYLFMFNKAYALLVTLYNNL